MEDFEEIDVQGAKDLITQGNVTIIDIRDADSYELEHIEGAQPVNDSNIEDFVNHADKDKTVICYCYRGIGSKQASQHLKEQGFKTVYSLMGGFEGWQQS